MSAKPQPWTTHHAFSERQLAAITRRSSVIAEAEPDQIEELLEAFDAYVYGCHVLRDVAAAVVAVERARVRHARRSPLARGR